MITPRAVASIEWLFEKSISNNCVSTSSDTCVVKRIDEKNLLAEAGNSQLIVISISSYHFRIIALLEFIKDIPTKEHFAKLVHCLGDYLEEDAYKELVNMICGEVNRGLGKVVPHIAMSTPFLLESTCGGYLATLKPAHKGILNVTLNDSVTFNVTICVCVDRSSTVDFYVDPKEQEETSGGELELL